MKGFKNWEKRLFKYPFTQGGTGTCKCGTDTSKCGTGTTLLLPLFP